MACNEKSFSALVSPQTPFGIITSFKDFYDHYKQGCVRFYTNSKEGCVNMRNVITKKEWVNEWKVLISAAYGAGEGYPHQIINKPFVVEPDSCCSQTYLVIGPFSTKEKCINVVSYIKTRFFRFMVMLKKNAQHAMRGVYQFVPMQDFSKPWVDEELYKKYNLTADEIKFIESMIKPME
jgi:site-specific DNA-methyltransferase (adenine-specific)